MKTFTFNVSAAVVVAFAATSAAQAAPPAPAAPPACSFSDLTGVTVTACSGFYDKNLLQGGTGADADADVETALRALGLNATEASSIRYVEKIGDLKVATPSNFNNVNFATRLYGDTIVGFHLGGGSVPGNATAFYRFNAGAAGVDIFSLNDLVTRGATSGAAVFQTSPVPEPGSYALMLAGLGAVGLMVQRRRPKA